ncbi:chromate efflux transporter [Cyanobium sp. ATX 6F1]|uniref:chromate efflux transporter n=1 Tax=unclassified Cyanobium TaxID=2627006 RepID=UPI0020CE5737|nr:chromate efflux transporter [Cyanobium sp. ATX 6F1]MCP9915688.1 chromate efflux transporter [Cyanobium sp. ATX 6F1]
MSRSVSFGEASRFWLQLGLISFGGPAGQVALMHSELVDRRRWLSERRFLHALNYAMVLPGPEAQQLATYIGWLNHGVAGGLVAGSLFILPSLLLLIALSTVYVVWGQLPALAAVFWALKPTVTAIVLQAAWRVGQRTLHNAVLGAIAVAAFIALTLLKLPFPALIAGAALIGWIGGRLRPELFRGGGRHGAASGGAVQESNLEILHGDDSPTPEHARFSQRRLALTLLAAALALGLPLAWLTAIQGWNGGLVTMARFFTQVALVSFGGAYAVLPYVSEAAVNQFHWLSASQMIDGLALGETTPGPLIMVVSFVGFMGGWNTPLFGETQVWSSAVAAALTVTWFTFLPSFVFILAGGPLVEASREDLRLGGVLTAITAAVVGVIVNLAVFFAGHVLWPEGAGGAFDAPALALMLAAGWALLAWRWSVLKVIGVAALVGLLRLLLESLG